MSDFDNKSKQTLKSITTKFQQIKCCYHFLIIDRVLLDNLEYLDLDGGHISLQIKVLFDVLYYFCWRGAKTWKLWKKTGLNHVTTRQ